MITNDSRFYSKADYVLNNDDRAISRNFPVATTNVITINDPIKVAINKLLNFLFDIHGKQVGYLQDVNVAYDKNKEKKDYYTRLHRHIKSLISKKTGEDAAAITYEMFKPVVGGNWIVLYIDPNAENSTEDYSYDYNPSDDHEVEGHIVTTMLDGLSDDSLTYENSGTQNMLTAFLSMFIKLNTINKLPYSDDYISKAQLNLNAQAYWLLDINDKKAEGTFYTVLQPSVWVTQENEIITTVAHKKFHSYELKSGETVTNEIDVFAPNLKGVNKKFHDDSNNVDIGIRQVNAVRGKGGPKYLVLEDLGKSILLYENYLAELMRNLCGMAGLDVTYNTFEPDHRGRPFAAFDGKPIKPKLLVVNAVPKSRRDQSYTEKTKAKKNVVEHKEALTCQQGTDIYIDFIKNIFSDYEVSVLSEMPNCAYDDLHNDCAYLIIQEPKKDGGDYWYSDNNAFEAGMLDTYGDDWQNHLGPERKKYWGNNSKKMSDKDKIDNEIALQHEKSFSYENDFIKLIGRYKRSIKNQTPFHTDAYTLWKIQQVISGLNNGSRKAIQAMHLPEMKVMKDLIAVRNGIKDGLYDNCWIKGLEEAAGSKTAHSVITKLKMHTLLKSYLTEERLLPLLDSKGDSKDYTEHSGEYRAYYVRRPKIGRSIETLFASQLNITISDKGIKINSVSIIDGESKLRAMEPALNEDTFERLYDSAFYLINEQEEVLTIYNSKRTGRIMACKPVAGEYKDYTLYGFFTHKLDIAYASDINLTDIKVGISKNKKTKTGGDESLLIAFLAQNSFGENHHPVATTKGKTINGGSEWIYSEDNGADGLRIYLTDKGDVNKKVSKGTQLRNILIHDKEGNKIAAAEHKLSTLYLNTISFDVASVNSFSATSILETMAKIALLN